MRNILAIYNLSSIPHYACLYFGFRLGTLGVHMHSFFQDVAQIAAEKCYFVSLIYFLIIFKCSFSNVTKCLKMHQSSRGTALTPVILVIFKFLGGNDIVGIPHASYKYYGHMRT